MELVRQSVLQDLPKIVASSLGLRKLFDTTPAFMGRYFWLEDSLSEVDDYDRAASAVWSKATKGHTDDGSLLTLFLCLAAGSTATTLLTEKTAASLIRKIRKAGPASGLQRDLAVQYIHAHAPAQYQDDYAQMWTEFLEDAQSTLFSDMDYALTDALSLLRRECNIKQ
jgi:protoporphyrinogen oxidase